MEGNKPPVFLSLLTEIGWEGWSGFNWLRIGIGGGLL
jgi:hypothetical protein